MSFVFRFYSLCLLIFFLAEMTIIALGFIYPNKLTEFLENELSDQLIQSYRDDLDFQNIIDLVQQDFECCGISSEGYLDWSKNEYFNCTENKEDNPSVERCGVPYSCCHRNDGTLVNLMCGFNVQGKAKTEAFEFINTRGCIPTIQVILKNYHVRMQSEHFHLQYPFQALIENNLYTVGGVAIGIALSQVSSSLVIFTEARCLTLSCVSVAGDMAGTNP